MTLQQQADAFLAKYRNAVPGPPPIVGTMTDEQLRADRNEALRIGAAFPLDSREGQIVGSVIAGWLLPTTAGVGLQFT